MNLFYGEAGPNDAPTIVLPHGSPRLPDAEAHPLDVGYFVLNEKNDEVASLIPAFLKKNQHV